MYRLYRLALLGLPLAAGALVAQAPRITPKGDPSVASDTIYKLAVAPAAHPEESSVLLLDDGVIRYEADGRGTRTFRMVTQILKQEAVEGYAEHSFSYYPGHQKLTINWIKVVRPDGQVVSDRPAQTQDSDVPASMGDPVYSDRRVRRVSLSGVAVGTIVDYSYTVEELKPFMRGAFLESWSVSTALTVRRSRLIVDVPSTLEPRIVERNLDFKRTTITANGRTVHTWARADIPRVKGEPFAADSNGVAMSVRVASPTTWQDVSRWYGELARDRYALTPAVEAKLAEVVAGARTLDDSVRAVHRWVAQDIRYVSIALGIGGYQPRTPAQVIETGFGDCKDKATLFVAALGRLGLTAYPVLLQSSGDADRTLPSIEQFDHAIAAVARPGGGYLYTDLTAELTPYGELPFSEQGGFALVVHPDGRGEEVTLPADPTDANAMEMLLVGTLSPEGLFDGRLEQSARGARQYGLRNGFSTPLDSTQRASFLRTVATNFFEGASGDSLVAFDGRDLGARPKIALRIRGGRAVTKSGDTEILTLPFGSMAGMAAAAAELEAQGPRKFTIDVEEIIGSQTSLDELRVTLPGGWRARLPQGVTATSAFGTYASEYSQAGRELRMTRRLTGAKGVLPPERIGELIEWFRAIGKDDAKFIVLERAASNAGGQ